MNLKQFLKKYYPEIIVLIIGITFGSFIMLSTFSQTNNTLYISSKAWSDFASHIPLIRSFSFGDNFPPEYPLFPGVVIKYHFIFYAFVGLLEKAGLPIDLALNIPSIIGFVLLILMIYIFAKLIFKNKAVGIISVIFFLFNSSLTFIYYFKNNPLTFQSILDIPKITNFQSFAPYGDGIISAFWNLNIYTNQRHLALAIAFSLFIIYLLVKPVFNKKQSNLKIAILLGIFLGLSFYIHLAVLMMTGIVILFIGILFSKIRISCFLTLFIGAIIAFPQYLYLNSSEGFNMLLNPGYLVAGNLTFYKFWEFWIYNLGLSIILIPLGFIYSDNKQRKVFLSFFTLFIVGNLIQFSPEIAANHKFFNYFIIIGNMFSAYALFFLWKKHYLLKLIVLVLIFFMVFGGILDFFPIFNDHKLSIPDYKINKEAMWIMENIPPDSVFLNTTYLYNPASLAGRKIFMGWPYFAWSQGYNTDQRGKLINSIMESTDIYTLCKLLNGNKINYLEINEKDYIQELPKPSNVIQGLKPIYNSQNNYFIYDINKTCPLN
jgi:hypothetical protein